MQVHQLLQPIVAIDDPTIEIVKIRGRKPAAIQRHERPQLRRNDRNDIQNHPVRLVAALAERFDHFEPLGVLELLLQRGFILHLLAQLAGKSFHLNPLEKLFNCLRAHHGFKARWPVLLIEFAVFRLVFDDLTLFYRSVTRFNHNVGFEIQNGLEITQRNIKKMADAAGQSLKEPHMRAGRGQLDVAQALAANFRQRDFHTALVADNAAMLHPLVLSAETLPIRYWAKNARAE